MKKIISILTILMISMSSSTVKSETYFKADFTSSNLYIDMLGIWATYGINKSIENFVIDNYLTMSGLSVDVDPYVNKIMITNNSDNILGPMFGFKFPNILNGLGTGIKWGYQKHYFSFLKSWALYGSVHATYNYYILDVNKIGEGTEKYGNSVMRVSPGIGANITIGKPTSPVSVLLDVNLRYDIPVLYQGDFGSGAGCLKSGLSPRITMIIGGPHLKKKGMNVGIFYEWMNYNLFKPSDYFVEPYKVKGYTFGINFTMFPWK